MSNSEPVFYLENQGEPTQSQIDLLARFLLALTNGEGTDANSIGATNDMEN